MDSARQTTNAITFAEQSKTWLRELEQRRRKPLAPASLRAFGAYVRKLTPLVGNMPLADINNGVAKQVVTALCDQGLAAKTVIEILATLKAIVASAVDPGTGKSLFPVEWNSKFIDAPIVGAQHQPCLTTNELRVCIKNADTAQEALFYCVLAGSGLRVSEALSIRVAGTPDQTSWDHGDRSIRVRSSVYQGKEQSRLKTPSARRTVDLDAQLNDLLGEYVASSKIQPGAFLFQSRTGNSMYLVTAAARLAKHGESKGFHAFRRFRITYLREFGVPEDILRFWAGHSGKGITDRYSKLAENTELRKQWASKCGLGFTLPELSKPKPSKSAEVVEPATLANSAVHAPAAPTNIDPPYVAEDNDLDDFFHSTPVLVSEEV